MKLLVEATLDFIETVQSVLFLSQGERRANKEPVAVAGRFERVQPIEGGGDGNAKGPICVSLSRYIRGEQ